MTPEALEKKRATSAKAIVDLSGKLNTAIETYLSSSTQLANELNQAGIGSPLNRVRLLGEVQSAVLVLLSNAKLPGAKARETQAKFSRGLRLGDINIIERI